VWCALHRAKQEAELLEAEREAAAAAEYQALLAAQDAERQAALQAMYAKSATRAIQAGKQVLLFAGSACGGLLPACRRGAWHVLNWNSFTVQGEGCDVHSRSCRTL